jgi:hypothetical protein
MKGHSGRNPHASGITHLSMEFIPLPPDIARPKEHA